MDYITGKSKRIYLTFHLEDSILYFAKCQKTAYKFNIDLKDINTYNRGTIQLASLFAERTIALSGIEGPLYTNIKLILS